MTQLMVARRLLLALVLLFGAPTVGHAGSFSEGLQELVHGAHDAADWQRQLNGLCRTELYIGGKRQTIDSAPVTELLVHLSDEPSDRRTSSKLQILKIKGDLRQFLRRVSNDLLNQRNIRLIEPYCRPAAPSDVETAMETPSGPVSMSTDPHSGRAHLRPTITTEINGFIMTSPPSREGELHAIDQPPRQRPTICTLESEDPPARKEIDLNALLTSNVASHTAPLVAVLDTGLEMNHAAMVNALGQARFIQDGEEITVHGWNYCKGTPDTFHGTFISGLIAAECGVEPGNEGTFPPGVAQNARVFMMRVFCQNQSPDPLHLKQAIEDAVRIGARVVNLSVVILEESIDGWTVFKDAIKQADKLTFVTGPPTAVRDDLHNFPSAWQNELDNLVVVQSTSWRSKRGEFIPDIINGAFDVRAPGTIAGIVTANTPNTPNQGVSNAIALVSGALAAFFGRCPNAGPAPVMAGSIALANAPDVPPLQLTGLAGASFQCP